MMRIKSVYIVGVMFVAMTMGCSGTYSSVERKSDNEDQMSEQQCRAKDKNRIDSNCVDPMSETEGSSMGAENHDNKYNDKPINSDIARNKNHATTDDAACTGPGGENIKNNSNGKACAEIKRDIGISLVSDGKFGLGKEWLLDARSESDIGADISIAFFSIIGVFNEYTYDEAISKLRRYKRNGNMYSARLLALQWLVDDSDVPAIHSKVNAYFDVRDAISMGVEKSLANKLAKYDAEIRANLSNQWVSGILYEEELDPMTDKRVCSLYSKPVNNVWMGLDSHGLYVESKRPLNVERYKETGVRIDSGHYYSALTPQKLIVKENIIEGVNSGVISFQEARRLYEEIKSRHDEPVYRFYLAKVGDNDFERFLREAALGETLKIRAVIAKGNTVITENNLLFEPGGNNKEPYRIFDLLGYIYLNCQYGYLD